MLVVYNASGAIVAILGVLIGLIAAVATGFLSVGLLAITLFWGFLGRRGSKAEAPAIQYVPLCLWAILPGILAVLVFPRDLDHRQAMVNPSEAETAFRQDEAGLASDETDDAEVSEAIRGMLTQFIPEDEVALRVKSSDDSMLILIQLDNLKRISPGERGALLKFVDERVHSIHPDKQFFIGIKGRLLYGAISTPAGGLEVAEAKLSVKETPLLAFYEKTEDPVVEESIDAETRLVSIDDNKAKQSGEKETDR